MELRKQASQSFPWCAECYEWAAGKVGLACLESIEEGHLAKQGGAARGVVLKV